MVSWPAYGEVWHQCMTHNASILANFMLGAKQKHLVLTVPNKVIPVPSVQVVLM
jgi:hypothetical protein